MIMCACLRQFNCLEMVGPSVRPEDGITGYAGDPTQVCVRTWTVIRALCCVVSGSVFYPLHTRVPPPLCHGQGPACAIVCAAATLYRNYFVNGGRGQRKPYQLNLLADVEGIVGNDRHKYWTVKNGYCLPVRARDTRTRLLSPSP